MIKAVIFDMDGVIVDSELIQSEAYETVLKKYGKEPILNEVGIVHTVGIKEKENWEILKKKYELEKNTELLMSERSVVYLDLLKQNTKPMKGVLELIKLLKEKNNSSFTWQLFPLLLFRSAKNVAKANFLDSWECFLCNCFRRKA